MYIIIDNKKIQVKEAKYFFQRLKGLMGEKNIKYGMLFKKANSIHTFFMKENIDIIGLNKKNEVIFKAINIPKNKIIIINNKLSNTNVLELPKNYGKNIQIGSILSFESK